jgi:hypothetical protein
VKKGAENGRGNSPSPQQWRLNIKIAFFKFLNCRGNLPGKLFLELQLETWISSNLFMIGFDGCYSFEDIKVD